MNGNDDHDDELDDGRPQWAHPGDLGVILLAGVFLVGMVGAILFIFSSANPVADLFGKKPPQANSSEVTVTVPPKD